MMNNGIVTPESDITSGNWLPYPSGLGRLIARFPLLAYRLGLGGWLNAIHLMVLTTRGRTSGRVRHTPVEYRRHGRKIYVVSVWGERPDWFQNALVYPTVTVQLGNTTYQARSGRVTDSAEALRALNLFRRIAPSRYDAVMGRLVEEPVNARSLVDLADQFTILRLDITDEATVLPGVPVQSGWLLPVGVVAAAGTLLVAAVAWLRRKTMMRRI